MKAEELRNLTDKELTEKIPEFREELFNLHFQLATGQLKNVKRIKEVKKNIARAQTVLTEREKKSKKS